jgi:hypothetical protein
VEKVTIKKKFPREQIFFQLSKCLAQTNNGAEKIFAKKFHVVVTKKLQCRRLSEKPEACS